MPGPAGCERPRRSDQIAVPPQLCVLSVELGVLGTLVTRYALPASSSCPGFATQFPSVPSTSPIDRETSAMLHRLSRTISTASRSTSDGYMPGTGLFMLDMDARANTRFPPNRGMLTFDRQQRAQSESRRALTTTADDGRGRVPRARPESRQRGGRKSSRNGTAVSWMVGVTRGVGWWRRR